MISSASPNVTAVMTPPPRQLHREEQLLVRLRINEYIAAYEWEEAAATGAAAIKRGPPSAELLRTACRLSSLGMVGGVSAEHTIAPLLGTPGLSKDEIRDGVLAVKTACNEDLDEFTRCIMAAVKGASSPQARLALLDAAMGLADEEAGAHFVEQPFLGVAVRAAFGEKDEARRAEALSILGSLAKASPSATCERLCPLLLKAAKTESTGAAQECALANLGDVSYFLSRLPPDDEHAVAVAEQLSSCLALFGTCLYAPTIALQTIAALSLCKIVLAASDAIPRPGDGDKEDKAPPRNAGGGKAGAAGRGKGGKGGKAKGAKKTAGKRQLPGGSDVDTSDEEEKPAEAAPEEEGTAAASNAPAQEEATTSTTTTILHSVANPEQLLAHLAQRYTAQSPHLDTMPKKEVAKNTDLMAKLQECFDVLARARRIADISNTVVFVLLNAGDEGALEPLRAPAVLGHAPPPAEVLDPRTLRCVRFLSHLLVEVIPWEEGDRPRADDLVKAVQVNLKMEHQLMVPRNEIARWLAVKV